MQVICEHPKVIFHPLIRENISKFKHFVILGRHFHYTSRRHPNDVYVARFYPHLYNVTPENADQCYFLDESTGETAPLYLVVACGHCDVCKMRKVNTDVDRLRMEAECYKFQPWFVTLTYNEDNVRHGHMSVVPHDYIRPPFYDRIPLYHGKKRVGFLHDSCSLEYKPFGGVNVRDCQLFLKRLRRNLDRHGFDFKFRYYLVSEYSPVKKRPHYHAIIFGLNTVTAADYFAVEKLISVSWAQGFTYCRRIDMSTDKSFYYTTKYMRKTQGQVPPDGCRRNFVLSSRGNGGIGAHFIDKVVKKSLVINKGKDNEDYDVAFKYRSNWSDKVIELRYSSYLLNRVFPSFSRLVSVETRKAFNQLSFCVMHIIRKSANKLSNSVYEKTIQLYHSLCKKVSPYIYTPDIETTRVCSLSPECYGRYRKISLSNLVSEFRRLFIQVKSDDRFCKRYLRLAENAQKTRLAFLGKLYQYSEQVDIFLKSYNAKRLLNTSSAMTSTVDTSCVAACV